MSFHWWDDEDDFGGYYGFDEIAATEAAKAAAPVPDYLEQHPLAAEWAEQPTWDPADPLGLGEGWQAEAQARQDAATSWQASTPVPAAAVTTATPTAMGYDKPSAVYATDPAAGYKTSQVSPFDPGSEGVETGALSGWKDVPVTTATPGPTYAPFLPTPVDTGITQMDQQDWYSEGTYVPGGPDVDPVPVSTPASIEPRGSQAFAQNIIKSAITPYSRTGLMTEMEMDEWENTGLSPSLFPVATRVPIDTRVSPTPSGEVRFGYGPMEGGDQETLEAEEWPGGLIRSETEDLARKAVSAQQEMRSDERKAFEQEQADLLQERLNTQNLSNILKIKNTLAVNNKALSQNQQRALDNALANTTNLTDFEKAGLESGSFILDKNGNIVPNPNFVAPKGLSDADKKAIDAGTHILDKNGKVIPNPAYTKEDGDPARTLADFPLSLDELKSKWSAAFGVKTSPQDAKNTLHMTSGNQTFAVNFTAKSWEGILKDPMWDSPYLPAWTDAEKLAALAQSLDHFPRTDQQLWDLNEALGFAQGTTDRPGAPDTQVSLNDYQKRLQPLLKDFQALFNYNVGAYDQGSLLLEMQKMVVAAQFPDKRKKDKPTDKSLWKEWEKSEATAVTWDRFAAGESIGNWNKGTVTTEAIRLATQVIAAQKAASGQAQPGATPQPGATVTPGGTVTPTMMKSVPESKRAAYDLLSTMSVEDPNRKLVIDLLDSFITIEHEINEINVRGGDAGGTGSSNLQGQLNVAREQIATLQGVASLKAVAQEQLDDWEKWTLEESTRLEHQRQTQEYMQMQAQATGRMAFPGGDVYDTIDYQRLGQEQARLTYEQETQRRLGLERGQEATQQRAAEAERLQQATLGAQAAVTQAGAAVTQAQNASTQIENARRIAEAEITGFLSGEGGVRGMPTLAAKELRNTQALREAELSGTLWRQIGPNLDEARELLRGMPAGGTWGPGGTWTPEDPRRAELQRQVDLMEDPEYAGVQTIAMRTFALNKDISERRMTLDEELGRAAADRDNLRVDIEQARQRSDSAIAQGQLDEAVQSRRLMGNLEQQRIELERNQMRLQMISSLMNPTAMLMAQRMGVIPGIERALGMSFDFPEIPAMLPEGMAVPTAQMLNLFSPQDQQLMLAESSVRTGMGGQDIMSVISRQRPGAPGGMLRTYAGGR